MITIEIKTKEDLEAFKRILSRGFLKVVIGSTEDNLLLEIEKQLVELGEKEFLG